MSEQPKNNIRLAPEHARAAVEAALAAYGPGNAQGVFGVAAGSKRVRGRRTSVPTLLVFVPRKLDEPTNPIVPVAFRYHGARHEVMPDVVATGRAAELTAGGRSAFNGLYAGCAIVAQSTKSVAGAAACLLGSSSGPTHLLTAGHLFAPGASNATVKAARGSGRPQVDVGRLARSLLDDPGDGPPLDAALIELTAEGRRMALETGANVRLPHLKDAPFESAHVASVWLKVFLPTASDYVARLGGEFRPSAFHALSPFGVEQTLRDVIVTDFAGNVEGNSGTILMTERGDPAPRAVGIAVGHAGALSLHAPVDQALQRLKRPGAQKTTIWSH